MVMTKVFGRLPTRFLYQKTHETPPYLEFKPEKEVIPYPLIFLHGILGSKQNWRSICHRLARDHHFKVNVIRQQCYSIDTRHHGEWKCSETFNYFKMAEDVKNFLDFHNIPKVNLVGHSMGGKTAMTFSQLYPDVLSTLTVVDIAPIRVRQFSMLNAYLEAMFSIDLANKSKDDVRNIMLDKLKDINLCDFILMNLKRDANGQLFWLPDKNKFIESFNEIGSFPQLEKNYDGPTMFVVGEKSEYVIPSDYPTIRDLYPQAVIREVHNVGHMIHMEAPDVFVSILSSFIQKHSD